MYKRTSVFGKTHQRQQWTELQARAALSELATTGESAAQFARRNGISEQKLAYWKKRLGHAGRMQFVPVTLPASRAAGPTVTSEKWIEIATSGVVVRVREGLDIDQVARLVQAIARAVSG
jgi:hypothetical protein